MARISRRQIVVIILILDFLIGCCVFMNRAFPRLALWNIIESERKGDFYWRPQDAPEYFYFEKDMQALAAFREDIKTVTAEKNKDFDKVIDIGRFINDICKEPGRPGKRIEWSSPQQILAQVKLGVTGAHCFYRAILLSTYLSSIGIESRLWAFENERFNGTSHSVAEVYVKELNKWVLVDMSLGFYVKGNNGIPLSVLEFREKLLQGKDKDVTPIDIFGSERQSKKTPAFYKKLMTCVFMRTGNDFTTKYGAKVRYGILSGFAAHLDKLPGISTRALDYVLGRRDFMLHYVDDFSKPLKKEIIFYRGIFYFFIVSLLFLGITAGVFVLKIIFKKTIRHK